LNGAWPTRVMVSMNFSDFAVRNSRYLPITRRIAGATSSWRRPGPRMVPIAAFSSAPSAEEDLVGFLALLVDAENADVADMVVAARIDAARTIVHMQRANLVLEFLVGKHGLHFIGDRDRARVGEVASSPTPGTR